MLKSAVGEPTIFNDGLVLNIYIYISIKTSFEKHYESLFTHCGPVMPYRYNIGSGNGLLPGGNKPLPEPMLTSCGIHLRVISQ